MNTVTALKTVKKNVKGLVEGELSRTRAYACCVPGPCWVPRRFVFFRPGLRLKLHPDDTYAYGLNRGGIDERWFASTTPCANENPHAGRRAKLRGRSPGKALSLCSRRSPNAAAR